MNDVKTKVIELIIQLFSTNKNIINDDIGPGDLSQWDSLGHLRLISELEKLFNFQFSGNDVMSMNNIKNIIKIINKNIDKK
jgi:acyl carrier protein|tara:strand:- start:1062 stop:1304 length:243 start_codon:yes stop_codon:yes gene_type:complete